MALPCGLLQALKMKRASLCHSHKRNRSRNGLGQQAALLHALLQVPYLLMLSTRMLVLDGRLGCSDSFPKTSRKESMLFRPTFEGSSPKLLDQDIAQDASIFLQWHPGEAVQRSWRAYGSQFFSIPSCWNAACWGLGQSEMGSSSRTWCEFWKGQSSPGSGTASTQSNACVQLRGTVNELLH